MEKQIDKQNQSDKQVWNSSAEMVLGFVIIGLLAGGVVGVLKAFSMTNGLDVMFCLLGSVAAFGAIYYIYFERH